MGRWRRSFVLTQIEQPDVVTESSWRRLRYAATRSQTRPGRRLLLRQPAGDEICAPQLIEPDARQNDTGDAVDTSGEHTKLAPPLAHKLRHGLESVATLGELEGSRRHVVSLTGRRLSSTHWAPRSLAGLVEEVS